MGPSLEDERRRHRSARVIAVASVVVVAAVVVVVWAIGALGQEVVRGSDSTSAAKRTTLAAAPPVLPAGKPVPQRLAGAVLDRKMPNLQLQLPINRSAVTGIGFGPRSGGDVVELQPAGTRANLSWGRRIVERFIATRPSSGLSWFRLGEGTPSMVTVGAYAGTDVYAPIDGIVQAIVPYVIDGEVRGDVIQIQPLGDAQTLVVLRNLDRDPDLHVGETVSEGATQLGTVRDMGRVVHAPIAAYTHDSGTSLELYVRRAPLQDGGV
ncbi:MAG: hypothetical protein JWN41_465 [Thermoleophilia bacterium]|nr:hypothetical protein [Thermoleophilia bacterium]